MKGYKGFDKDLVCSPNRNKQQYEVGKTYEMPEKDVSLCQSGYHFCEYPLDVFGYYAPSDSRYCEIEAEPITQTDNDSKRVTSKIKIGAEIGIKGMIEAAIKFTFERATFTEGNSTSGYRGAAQASGDRGAAQASGDQGAATVTGKESIASGLGYDCKARGALGCWIVLAEREDYKSNYHIKQVKTAKVDGETIKVNVFYKLVDGEFVEV